MTKDDLMKLLNELYDQIHTPEDVFVALESFIAFEEDEDE